MGDGGLPGRRLHLRADRRLHQAAGSRRTLARHRGGSAALWSARARSVSSAGAAGFDARCRRPGKPRRARHPCQRDRSDPVLPADGRYRRHPRIDSHLSHSALRVPVGRDFSRRDAHLERNRRRAPDSRRDGARHALNYGRMGTVVALAAQVGGAKLADGLYRLRGRDLTVIVNTGDDYDHLGLLFSPDLDTVLYALAGIASAGAGWEPEGESRVVHGMLKALGGPDRPPIGDKSLAAPILRTEWLKNDRRLTQVTLEFCNRLRIQARVLPMSDDPVRA